MAATRTSSELKTTKAPIYLIDANVLSQGHDIFDPPIPNFFGKSVTNRYANKLNINSDCIEVEGSEQRGLCWGLLIGKQIGQAVTALHHTLTALDDRFVFSSAELNFGDLILSTEAQGLYHGFQDTFGFALPHLEVTVAPKKTRDLECNPVAWFNTEIDRRPKL